MSPKAQQLAIAIACAVDLSYASPDYLNDLNAMHAAESVLTPAQSERFAEFILDVLQIPSPFIGTARAAFLTGHANAGQRAEAFLRTLNLWIP